MNWKKYGKFEPYLVPALLVLIAVTYGILAVLSDGTHGGADDISHFRRARYAFQHPEFFLHHWGKPFFTAVTAPFAQFGFNGMRIFNVLVGTLTAYFTYRTAKELNFRFPVLAIFLTISSPLYVVLMMSGMTEILFSLMLILSIFLFLKKKYIGTALILSFLPFVRNEGIVILPLFLVALAWMKQWKALPFMLFGFVFYSIVGGFYYDDFLWVIHKMPYTGSARDIYGSGDLFHYARSSKVIFGVPLALLVLAGLFFWVADPFTKAREARKQWLMVMLVVYMPFLAYFAAHSLVWWKGWGNSVGLIRVIVAVLPSAVLLGVFAWDRLLSLIPVRALWKQLVTGLLCIYLVTLPFHVYKIPVPLMGTQKLVKEAADWMRNSPYFEHRIYFYDPFLTFFMKLNPWDKERVHEFVYSREHPEERIEEGEIVIWDAHFSPNEGRLPLENLMDNPGFRLIHVVRPGTPFTVLGGYNYEIYIFQRITEDDGADNHQIYESLLEERMTEE
ncbi:MAG: hypothetical protein ACWGNV_09120 [Bacteroidales bacterium]